MGCVTAPLPQCQFAEVTPAPEPFGFGEPFNVGAAPPSGRSVNAPGCQY